VKSLLRYYIIDIIQLQDGHHKGTRLINDPLPIAYLKKTLFVTLHQSVHDHAQHH
jgi:hypothetical protein